MAALGRYVGLVCLDLDGTLYHSATHSVSARNAAAVAMASKAGYAICLCTGRSMNCRLPSAAELGGVPDLFLVGCNGAVVVRLAGDGSPADTFFETRMSDEQLTLWLGGIGKGRALKADVGNRQFAQYTTDAQKALVEAHNVIETSKPTVVSDLASELRALPPGSSVHKFTVFADSPSASDARALNEEAASLGSVGGVALVAGGPSWVDTIDVEHDKAAGVALLAERLGVKLEDCIAMGDGANDATMLRTVGVSVAMGQGREEAKAAAKRVSAWTNDEDAVARELEAILAERAGK